MKHTKDMQQWWFLDDSTILGSPTETVTAAFHALQQAFHCMALRISMPKTIYFSNVSNAVLTLGDAELPSHNRVEILGADVQVPHLNQDQQGKSKEHEAQQGRNAEKMEQNHAPRTSSSTSPGPTIV